MCGKRSYRMVEALRGLEHIRFGAMELLALYAARGALAPAAGAPFYADLQRVITKVRGELSRHQNGALDGLAGVFLPHTRRYIDYGPFAETIDVLVDAIARRKVCRVRYRAGGTARAREHLLHPLRILFHEGALYVFCRFAERATVGKIVVHRIASIRALDQRFRPPRVDLGEQARRAFGIFDGGRLENVEVVFSKELSWLAKERVFHPDERKKLLPDGRTRLRLRTGAQGEVVSWVLRFGGGVELVRPKNWRMEVARLAEAMRGRHRG
jgi:predicted DNA-binding transcriptional regulator YafY